MVWDPSLLSSLPNERPDLKAVLISYRPRTIRISSLSPLEYEIMAVAIDYSSMSSLVFFFFLLWLDCTKLNGYPFAVRTVLSPSSVDGLLLRPPPLFSPVSRPLLFSHGTDGVTWRGGTCPCVYCYNKHLLSGSHPPLWSRECPGKEASLLSLVPQWRLWMGIWSLGCSLLHPQTISVEIPFTYPSQKLMGDGDC